MNDKKMIINKNLDLTLYLAIVENLSEGFFSINNEYRPDLGIINAMRIFYNICVKESKFDTDYPHEITDALDMEAIVADDEFLRLFNENLTPIAVCFDFANAYSQAVDIVNNKKDSLFYAVGSIEKTFEKMEQYYKEIENLSIDDKNSKDEI